MPANYTELEKTLWDAADNLRANSALKPSEYSVPVLGLIFLRYASYKFEQVQATLAAVGDEGRRRKRGPSKDNYIAAGALYVPESARYQTLLNLTDGDNVGAALDAAMQAIAQENEDLSEDDLFVGYSNLEKSILLSLLKTFNVSSEQLSADAFGEIYQYFLTRFANKEGQKGGEFFTPISIVRLIVEVIEPDAGRILDPACGAGGMFVQSAAYVRDRLGRDPNTAISVYGQEKIEGTVKLCRMNLAVHGISGLRSVMSTNTYYEDVHGCVGEFDYVMANPPFNVDGVDKKKIENDPRFPFGIPNVDNANYLWIQLFYTALNGSGRAGFVMANSASDARGSELTIRQQMIAAGAVDVMIAVGSNFFYTVTLPCTLWFFDRAKAQTPRADQVLFIDARHVYEQVDRAHREFSAAQVVFLSNIVRLYRGEAIAPGAEGLMAEHFPAGVYGDVLGLCKVATVAEVEAQGWSLNPGRYVGVADRTEPEDFDFLERLEGLNEELEGLNREARVLEERIAENMAMLLECD